MIVSVTFLFGLLVASVLVYFVIEAIDIFKTIGSNDFGFSFSEGDNKS